MQRSILILLLVVATPLIAADKPNILFIAIDDLNDWVGPLRGHPQVQTPHMDRLATRGTTFLNAHCQSPLCNPSRTSLMTGLRPSTTGIYGLAPWFRNVDRFKDRVTLPQHFEQNGYTTYSTGKIYHGRNGRKDTDNEFQYLGPPAGVGARPEKKIVQTPFGNHPLVDWGTFPHRDEDKGDWIVASWAEEQLDEKPKEPFFLSVGFFLPHVPCYATQKWFDLYPNHSLMLPPMLPGDRDDTPRFSWYLHWSLPEVRLTWLQQEQQWKPIVRAYLASISFVDSQVGRVLDALDRGGYTDNTIVVLWSDHGWHLGEKQHWGKWTGWDRSTRVPLIVAPAKNEHSRFKIGATCQQPVNLVDLYPTLVQLCDIERPDGLSGESLEPLLRAPTAALRGVTLSVFKRGNYSLRTTEHRLIHYADGSREFYHLKSDPNEWTNLAERPEYASFINRLAQFLPDTK